MNFSSWFLVDQSYKETLKTGKDEKKTREGDEGVSQSLHLLGVVDSTRRREADKVKVTDAAKIGFIATVCGKTPSEVEVSPRVGDGGSEAEDEDVEEAAQLPMLPPILSLTQQLPHVNALTFFLLLKHIN